MGDGDRLGEETQLFSGRIEVFDTTTVLFPLYVARMIKSNHLISPLIPCMPLGASMVDSCQGWGKFGSQDRTGVPWPGRAEDTTARGEQSQNAAQTPEQRDRSSAAGQDLMGNLCNCTKCQPAFIAHLYSQ